MIPEIREAMRAYAAEKAADGIVLCLTDIMEEGSQVLLEGDTEAAQKGLEIADVAEGVWMPGVLSARSRWPRPSSPLTSASAGSAPAFGRQRPSTR